MEIKVWTRNGEEKSVYLGQRYLFITDADGVSVIDGAVRGVRLDDEDRCIFTLGNIEIDFRDILDVVSDPR